MLALLWWIQVYAIHTSVQEFYFAVIMTTAECMAHTLVQAVMCQFSFVSLGPRNAACLRL